MSERAGCASGLQTSGGGDPSSGEEDSRRAPTVLVVDDDEVMREGCAEALAPEGYRVAVASSGAEGLDLASRMHPDVVVLDLRMPGLGGIEVTRRLADVEPMAVVVVITGYATIDHAVESIKSGAFDFLPKPFTPADLRQAVGRALERKEAAAELEALRAEKRRLNEYYTSIISHQLRTPIAAVRQYFAVVLDGLVGDVPPEIRRVVERASIRLTELTALIEDWLSLVQVDDRALRARFRPTDLESLLRRRIAELGAQLEARSMTARLERTGPVPRVAAHSRSIEQVFDNLLSNAVKYGRPGGHVTVRMSPAVGQVVVEVEDDGLGVAEEHLPFLFNEFYRAKNDQTRDIPGTGLGLAIVRKFVEAHGGTVDVESRLGAGSTFAVRLPVGRGPGGGPEPPGEGDARAEVHPEEGR